MQCTMTWMTSAAALASALVVSSAVSAASVLDPPAIDNGVSVALIQQDQSDCHNTTVRDNPNRVIGGEIIVTAVSGTTTVVVGFTAAPNTVYNLYLKCVQALGEIRTDDEGVGLATFTFPSSLAAKTFAFDMYPGPATPGTKFQSLTVTMP
jgi:hypothetical protein